MTVIAQHEWDGHLALNVGAFIGRYLADNPPPDRSAVAAQCEKWARELTADGRARLASVNRRHLTLVN